MTTEQIDPVLIPEIQIVANHLINHCKIPRPGTYRSRLWEVDLDLILTQYNRLGVTNRYGEASGLLYSADWQTSFTGQLHYDYDLEQAKRIYHFVISKNSATVINSQRLLTDLTMIKLSGALYE